MNTVRRRALLQTAAAWASWGGAAGGLSLAALAPGSLQAQTTGQAPPAYPAVSTTAGFDWPELSLLDGRVLPPAAWQDTGAVLVFWATHCPFCRRHNQHVEKLHRALAGQKARVLGLSSDRDPERVRRYMQEQGLSFAVSMQSELLRTRLGLRRTLPTTLSFDRRGRPGLPIPGEMFEDDVLGLARAATAT